jgi:ABC-2 type transport system permease protein
MRFAKSLTRISSFVGKELVEIIRRPGAFVSLVLGPFLIMAVFGVGYSGTRRAMETVLVIPEEAPLSRETGYYQDLAGPAIHIQEVTTDGEAARQRLAREEIDLVVVAPADMEDRFRGGEQSQIVVQINEVDPVLSNYAYFLAERITREVNSEILRRAVAEGEQYAVQQLDQPDVLTIPPEVVAQPTTASTENVSPTEPNVVAYFGPALLALVLQHMAVTLSALSLVRERLGGVMEIFRVSPINTPEILIGKYVGFGVLNLLVGGILLALLVGALRVPFLGSPVLLAVTLILITFASLGLGLVISLVADSERSAVQLSLLVLLASVFFSGMVLPVEEFAGPVQVGAHVLPVTNGIRMLQDVMLRGGTYAPWHLGVLAGVGVVLFVIAALLLRRSLRSG